MQVNINLDPLETLGSWQNKRVLVIIDDKTEIEGVLMRVDEFLNVLLCDAIDRTFEDTNGAEEVKEKRFAELFLNGTKIESFSLLE